MQRAPFIFRVPLHRPDDEVIERVDAEHHRRLEAMYHSAPVNQAYEPELEVEHGAARLTMQAKRSDYHAADAVHGHVLFKMMDDAAFFAANSLVRTFVLTVHFDVHLLKPVTAGELRCHAEVLHEGASSILADAIVTDEAGDQAARGTGSFVKGKRSLDELDGYVQADVGSA